MNIDKFFNLLIFATFLALNANQTLASDKGLNPYLVIDIDDGSVILANNEFVRWYPASLTKLMTAFVAMKAISEGEIEIGSPVRISNRANKMPASRMGYKTGTLLRVDSALKILIVKSANDVAVALAESVAGSVDNFVQRMNENAKFLGLTMSHFSNPNGLHSPKQYTSARDLAILSRRILLDFPQYSHWFAIPAIRTAKKTHYSYNLLLERFDGATGMKTGFVCASGYNMVASAKRDKRRLIAVILGEKSQSDRAILAAKLLNEAYANPKRLIGNVLVFGGDLKTQPINMRSILCTEKARINRYEPGAGKAVIKSPHLLTRKISQQPIMVKVGGVDADPSKAYAMQRLTPQRPVVIPIRRPQYTPPLPIDNLGQLNTRLRGTVAIPTIRPNS